MSDLRVEKIFIRGELGHDAVRSGVRGFLRHFLVLEKARLVTMVTLYYTGLALLNVRRVSLVPRPTSRQSGSSASFAIVEVTSSI